MTPQSCPKCAGTEIDASGVCPGCGFDTRAGSAPPETTTAKPSQGVAGLIEISYSVTPEADKPELPQWRVELSKRLQEIKLRRDSGPESSDQEAPSATLPFNGSAQAPPLPPLPEPPPPEPPVTPPRRQPKPARPSARAQTVPGNEPRPTQPEPRLPLFEAAKPKPPETSQQQPEAPQQQPERAASGKDAIQELIDRAVARQASDRTAAPAQPAVTAPHPHAPPAESKLILLSRTLSGLVDLVIIVLCAGGTVVAADYFSGIDMLDRRSLTSYGALLAATYFVYSSFFLLSANQTIGMMITELRVVDATRGRPDSGKLLGRCILYLISVLALGLGLLWGCFDGQSRCLHDRLSGTKVVRVGS